MKIQFITKKLGPAKLGLINHGNTIVEEYERQGYTLTLRQLYYQMVSRDLIPNTVRSYKTLGNAISDGRLCGLIDWQSLEDRGRNMKNNNRGWNSPGAIIRACANQFEVKPWEDQPKHVEVWVEKQALENVIEDACDNYRVPFISCKGYMSQSEMYVAGCRLRHAQDSGKDIHIIHLGDHDPSGIDMSRDISDRLELLANAPGSRTFFVPTVHRIALNMDQVIQYDPPPNPAKVTDSRAADYIRKFGRSSWELDALEPSVLRDLIASNLAPLIDHAAWDASLAEEEKGKAKLNEAANNL